MFDPVTNVMLCAPFPQSSPAGVAFNSLFGGKILSRRSIHVEGHKEISPPVRQRVRSLCHSKVSSEGWRGSSALTAPTLFCITGRRRGRLPIRIGRVLQKSEHSINFDQAVILHLLAGTHLNPGGCALSAVTALCRSFDRRKIAVVSVGVSQEKTVAHRTPGTHVHLIFHERFSRHSKNRNLS